MLTMRNNLAIMLKNIGNFTNRRSGGGRKTISILLSVGGAAFILFLGLVVGSIISKAQSPDNVVSYKYFTSIMVKPGDTLWSIAQSYSDGHFDSDASYIQEVIDTNHLSDEELHAGDYLIVPYYSTEFK